MNADESLPGAVLFWRLPNRILVSMHQGVACCITRPASHLTGLCLCPKVDWDLFLLRRDRNTHWKQTVFYLDDVLTVCDGEEIRGKLKNLNSPLRFIV